MDFTFLNPLMLLGIAAGILPILIHRLTEKKAKLKNFPAVRLLLPSPRVMAQPRRLKNIFLLILRILAVVSLILITARPVWTGRGLAAMDEGGENVVILDNSLSMGFEDDTGRRYDLAKRAAAEFLESSRKQTILIPTASVQGGVKGEVNIQGMAPQEALKEVNGLPLSFGRGNPASVLSRLYQGFKGPKSPKEILIISDMARGDWEGFNLGKIGAVPSEANLTFLRIGGAQRDSNLAVKEVKLISGEAVIGIPARLEVTVVNFSDYAGSTVVQLFLSHAKMGQKAIQLKPGEEGKTNFELYLDKSGWMDGEVKLSVDRLPSDDVYYFSLKVRKKVKVIVVDGDPGISFKAGESYYLASALNPGGSDRSPFDARVITEGELENLDLSPYEALFLLNASKLQGPRLASFLESGRPVFIFLGDRVIPEEYNKIPLFPWRLKEVIDTGSRKPDRIAQIDFHHEVLKPLSGQLEKSLQSASFRRYFKVEGETENLLTLEHKDPLLLAANRGKGKIFLFTSSSDLDWNDLPLQAAYLPFIQGMLGEMVGLSRDSIVQSMRYDDLGLEEISRSRISGSQGGAGIYKFLSGSGEKRSGVNPSLEESDLGKMSPEDLKKIFGPMNIRIAEYKEGGMKPWQGGRKELWPFFLAFLLVVLAVEMGVANRI